ncbi:hypothetical protein AVEN_16263-1 [Araneus ventricosus]|uniref:Uncharacterized protein n=1 Tax=Araneus ventricosus TaxID=182803 RepID=A0A4Y2W769_ARAVE|nr:hypothetical protein AVEN_192732-1 [Araneus ventricosus]GBO32864.1 hypothetical protein AVEN_16263-1 [Araneus ventricosus]
MGTRRVCVQIHNKFQLCLFPSSSRVLVFLFIVVRRRLSAGYRPLPWWGPKVVVGARDPTHERGVGTHTARAPFLGGAPARIPSQCLRQCHALACL